jgi:hypothetical protein
MKRLRCSFEVLGALGILLFCGTAAKADFSIMPLGASFANGDGVPGGYRTRLYSDLQDVGYSFTFVGTSTENPSRLLSQAGQTHHEGHSGYRIDQIANNLDGNDGSAGNNGGFWFHKPAPPNIILLTDGAGNDIAQGADASTTVHRNGPIDRSDRGRESQFTTVCIKYDSDQGV